MFSRKIKRKCPKERGAGDCVVPSYRWPAPWGLGSGIVHIVKAVGNQLVLPTPELTRRLRTAMMATWNGEEIDRTK